MSWCSSNVNQTYALHMNVKIQINNSPLRPHPLVYMIFLYSIKQSFLGCCCVFNTRLYFSYCAWPYFQSAWQTLDTPQRFAPISFCKSIDFFIYSTNEYHHMAAICGAGMHTQWVLAFVWYVFYFCQYKFYLLCGYIFFNSTTDSNSSSMYLLFIISIYIST